MPILELFLARAGTLHVAEQFVVNEAVNRVAFGESGRCSVAILPKPTDQVGSNVDVKRAEWLACKDVGDRLAFATAHDSRHGARWILDQVQPDRV